PASLDAINAAFSDARDAAAADIAGAGYGSAAVLWFYSADVRYRGQASQLTVKLAGERLDDETLRTLRADFEAEHQTTFGYTSPEEKIEVVNLRLTARVSRSDDAAAPQSRLVERR